MSGETQADGPPVLSIVESVATICLNRPSQHNRIDPEDLAPIRGFIAEIASNPAIIALVFTGTGTRTFSSGYTLSRVGANFDDSFEKMLNDVEQCPVPTICALNGSVYGGSTDLALCCDIRIGVRGSRMFMPAARIGMHYYPDGIRRYVRELGPAIAKYLFLTAMPLADVDMLRVGFLTELVEQTSLNARLSEYIAALRECESSVVRSMKRQISQHEPSTTQETASREYFERALQSDELRNRIDRLDKN